jgi:hypothetical protein
MPKKQFSEKDIRKLLEEGIPWPPELQEKRFHERQHDDNDGTDEGWLAVSYSNDGDVVVSVHGGTGSSLRFRTPFGGGGSPRVRNALVLLAFAIHLDNEA